MVNGGKLSRKDIYLSILKEKKINSQTLLLFNKVHASGNKYTKESFNTLPESVPVFVSSTMHLNEVVGSASNFHIDYHSLMADVCIFPFGKGEILIQSNREFNYTPILQIANVMEDFVCTEVSVMGVLVSAKEEEERKESE